MLCASTPATRTALLSWGKKGQTVTGCWSVARAILSPLLIGTRALQPRSSEPFPCIRAQQHVRRLACARAQQGDVHVLRYDLEHVDLVYCYVALRRPRLTIVQLCAMMSFAVDKAGPAEASPHDKPATSWDSLRNWDTAPEGAPPPAPPQPPKPPATKSATNNKRVGAQAVMGGAEEVCTDPNCTDPNCMPFLGTLKRRERARFDKVNEEKARLEFKLQSSLQKSMMKMAKEDKAEEIMQLCEQGLSASYASSIGQTPLHVAGIWNSVEAAEVREDGSDRLEIMLPRSRCCC